MLLLYALCKISPIKQVMINLMNLFFNFVDSLNYCGFYYEDIYFERLTKYKNRKRRSKSRTRIQNSSGLYGARGTEARWFSESWGSRGHFAGLMVAVQSLPQSAWCNFCIEYQANPWIQDYRRTTFTDETSSSSEI